MVPLGADLVISAGVFSGQRRCPNEKCNGLIFIVTSHGQITSYPPELIDFDANDVPASVKAAFEEALHCRSIGRFTATAMMIRRTVELVCEERGASGANLFERIEALKSRVVIPDALLTAMHELRLLGNDAAHVNAKEYAKIGKDEVDAAIDCSKEIMKAVFGYTRILANLQRLKNPPPPASAGAAAP